ncbi:MAG: imidazole glycerol phosphate synthase subunit HisH [Candidatus Omnitrophica bacterium]|nr:imidazole glycerol phosphate synthase subunit HisH [Candidatus Omnitrophota bacterium]MDE2008830.1 imidazole glycerol phosphate synthase subunit HisH [Candidatus Omnitrophota bacterium]MDE2213607.1 imidazole glycerol phosphate synthase subunit HisH [Candidatus Omnitrophota bacterium]MDE2230492.1 imidazole glycerol phosphate synthase subunit HisH [Candidatus Omnitrophota bacterium]
MIAIIDYGMGNLRSVAKAFEAVGAKAQVTNNIREILLADKVVLPGVGAMGPAMQKLQELDLSGPIRKVIQDGKPFLGICLGMQLLFERSSEGGFAEGLKILKGNVERFGQLKVPHMGWNQVNFRMAGHQMFKGLATGENMYFCHSYFVKPLDAGSAAGITNYGNDFVCAVAQNNIWGVQFHPEKSQAGGLQILKNFGGL